MTNGSEDLPTFPTTAPDVFRDKQAIADLYGKVLRRLGGVVDVDDDALDRPTPCSGFTVAELRTHILGWLQFFAAALSDPAATSPRPDPDAFVLADGAQASEVVRQALNDIEQAIDDDAAGEMVTMTSSLMAGDGVLGMALGEYIVHAWDLASATGQPYEAPESAVEPALEFLRGMVAPEYRGPDSGFFDAEVEVPDDAPPLDKLLGFAGRDPHWTAS